MTRPVFLSIAHVQLGMPPGSEEKARAFYAGLLGMTELPKPPELAKRGGAWFESGPIQIHVGGEEGFRPSLKAHPALVCSDYDGLLARLKAAGVECLAATEVPGLRRGHIKDPFGNRIELIAA